MSEASPEVKKGHQRTDTALIHGLAASDVQRLQDAAVAAKDKAYCPYSNFRVGAALLTSNNDIIPGANVENASYPNGTCAERVAIGTAVLQGVRPGDIRAVAVAADTDHPISPCGMCRQVIREFCELTVPIVMFDNANKSTVRTLGQLLPMSFGPEDLKR